MEKGKMHRFHLYIKRDFCLPMIELWDYAEAEAEIPFLKKRVIHRPYIIFERAEGTVSSYYNQEGMAWVKSSLVEHFKAHPEDLKSLSSHILLGIKPIKSLYDKPKALPREQLLKFIEGFQDVCPKAVVIWLLCGMEEDETKKLDLKELKKIRAKTERLSAGTDIVIRKSLEKLYPKLGLLSSMIGLEELRADRIPSEEELSKRLSGFIYFNSHILTDKHLLDLEKDINITVDHQKVDESLVIIKGQTGCRGKAKGKVCRVMGHSDFGKIKKGEILVSPMTMVDFLPEMKKAAAIITDEGGMTSHAAIVSRELKIPCVVGAKIATKVLKDGDLVEVDADKGIIRVIEKSDVERNDD
jgi:phosphohistidine swiveling domain-containing protein